MLDRQQAKAVRTDYRFKRNANGAKVSTGITVPRIATAIFDTAGLDSSGVSNKTAATHGLGVYIPKGAIITKAWYEVVTALTTSASATVALQANAANDLVSAIAISDGTNPYALGNHGCLPGNPAEATVAGDTGVLAAARMAATYIGAVTAEKELKVVVGVGALTAGKLILFVEFHQGI